MKSIKEQVAVMLAADEGKDVICIPKSNVPVYHINNNTHKFDWHLHDYEIVEEPWEGWVNIYDNGVIALHKSASKAWIHCGDEGRTIKIREVIE